MSESHNIIMNVLSCSQPNPLFNFVNISQNLNFGCSFWKLSSAIGDYNPVNMWSFLHRFSLNGYKNCSLVPRRKRRTNFKKNVPEL